MIQCPVVYRGKSYPQFNGTQCQLEVGHDEMGETPRHYALVGASPEPLSWYTEKQKETVRRRREDAP